MKKFLVLLLPFFLFGCKEDEVKKTDSELLKEFFAEYEPQGIVRTVDADSAIEIIGNKATLGLTPDFLHWNGDDVSGEMQIEFRELYYKSDFLLANKQTMTNHGELLQSAGVFYVKATQDGEALKFRGQAAIIYNFINIYPSVEESEFEAMEVYSGKIDSNNTFEWTNGENPNTYTGVYIDFDSSLFSSGLIISTTDAGNAFVDPTFENLEWINVDAIVSDTLPTSSVSVTVIGNLGGESVAAVFLVFKEINSILEFYWAGTTFESPGNIPINLTATVVVIAVNDGVYYFGTEEITVAAANNITVTVTETSKADMAAAIKTLDD